MATNRKADKGKEGGKTMIRVRHRGGEETEKGNYENFSTQERISLGCEGRLPGNAATTALVLAAGPVLGLIYAAFLPFIGIGIVTKLVLSKLARKPAEGWARVATFNWRPTEAYLAGRRHTKKGARGDRSPKEEKVTGNDAE
jgi:hypothetical protein